MKKSFSIFACALFSAVWILNSCAAQKQVQEMQVVRDCTGTYLRINKKDYHVCNIERIANYADGQTIKAAFKKIGECEKQPEIVCMMFHENEGWVEITKVK